MEIVSLNDARHQNLKHYFTGIPCSRGHVCSRITANRNCVKCASEKAAQYHAENIETIRKRKKDYRAANSTHMQILETRRKLRNFGVEQDEIDVLVARINGICDVCLLPEYRTTKRGAQMLLALDHDHITGKFRGLLCQDCNLAAGLVKDNPVTADSLARYLRTHSV